MGLTVRQTVALSLAPWRFGELVQRPLDAWQEQVCQAVLIGEWDGMVNPPTTDAREAGLPRFNALLRCGRQVGKSETAAQIASVLCLVPECVEKAHVTVVLCSPSQRQSGEIHRRVVSTLEQVDAQFAEKNRMSLALSNGSRFIALPGSESTVRGISSVDLLILDEAAYVDDRIFTAIRPMIAVAGGVMMMLSSPAGAEGFFHAVDTSLEPGWARWHIPSTVCPRISDGFLLKERELMGEALFRREYLAEYVSELGGLFTEEEVQQMLQPIGAPVVAPSMRQLLSGPAHERNPSVRQVARGFRMPDEIRRTG